MRGTTDVARRDATSVDVASMAPHARSWFWTSTSRVEALEYENYGGCDARSSVNVVFDRNIEG